MKAGRRVADPATKEMMGTHRKDRHGNITTTAKPPSNVPVPPGYLSKEAMMVWHEEFGRVIACGAVEADSSIFARYCVLEAEFRGLAATGKPITAASVTELRRTAELLGIAGARSRLVKLSGGEGAKASPFTMQPK